MAVCSYLFDDTVAGQMVSVGGPTQQQSSFEASGHRLSKRPQELREEALKVWFRRVTLVLIRCCKCRTAASYLHVVDRCDSVKGEGL